MKGIAWRGLSPRKWSLEHWIVVIGLLVALVVLNQSILKKEWLLANGDRVLLELAPVDPRSLMQGDYMALRFQLEDDIYNALPEPESGAFWKEGFDAFEGRIVVTRDAQQVARFVALYSDQTLEPDQMLLAYRVRQGEVKFASNAFFFEEGEGQRFEFARYGEFKVSQQGELLLNALYDQNVQLIDYD